MDDRTAYPQGQILPRETIRQRIAANEIAERVRGMRELTRLLGHFLGEEPAQWL